MKQKMRRLLAGALSAVLLGTAMPLEAVSAAESAAAVDTFRQIIRNAWENCTENVRLSNVRMTSDEVIEAYYDMLYTDAKWFYVDSSFNYTTSISGRVSSMILKYNYDKSEVPSMIEAFDGYTVDTARSEIKKRARKVYAGVGAMLADNM